MNVEITESSFEHVPEQTVKDRLENVNFDELVYQLDTVLQEFSNALDGPDSDVYVTGLVVVGSVLTDDFKPHESDLDVYVLTNESFEYDDGFRRAVADTHTTNSQWIGDSVGDVFTCLDYLGSLTMDSYESFLRDPHVVIT